MMNHYYFYVIVYMYVMGIFSYCSNRKNILCMLLSLEFMSLSLFGCIYVYMIMIECEKYFLLYYLIFCVCEGAMGLSLLISMIRFYGNDYFQSLSLLKC